MNVTETKSDGLSREFRVSIPKGEIAAKLNAKITELQPKMNIKGFRPGKVPAAHIKKLYGKSIMGDLVNDLVQETSDKALADKALRPASRPSIQLDTDEEKLINGEADLDYSMKLEVMPEFEPADVSTISIERMVADVPEEEIQESLKRLADNNKAYEAKEGKAETGDAVVIDFVGSIDGEKFDGGAAEGHTLVIGSGRFIPGFEEQLVGVAAGDDVKVNVTFPEEYQVETLKGKPALFEVKVHEVKGPKDVEINDEFAKTLGLESLESLRDAITKGPLAPQRVVKILIQCCASLAEAHSIGIIHRDIKPDNVFLLNMAGSPDFVKLLDFSVAKLLEGDRMKTQAGVVFGTP
ncbi:MAG: trigger factor, partial [Hyphomonadaceae bacterium]